MPIETRRRLLFIASVLAAALSVTGATALAAPELSPKVERQVSSPTPTAFSPSEADEAAALAQMADYVDALNRRDYAAAYAMFSLAHQAATPRLEWEMNQRKRPSLWADGAIKILRMTWYPDPPDQPPGVYVALDFRGDRADGTMDCGYLVVYRAAPGSDYSVTRTDTSEILPSAMEEGVPRVDVLRQLPCYLGPGIATAL